MGDWHAAVDDALALRLRAQRERRGEGGVKFWVLIRASHFFIRAPARLQPPARALQLNPTAA